MQWICIRKNFTFSHLFQVGDIVESEESPNHHFTLFERFDDVFPLTGRKFLVEEGQITGVWDG